MGSTARRGGRGGVRDAGRGRRWGRWAMTVVALVGVLLLGPLGVLAFGDLDLDTHWSSASRASSGLAPAPRAEPEPMIQVYGARTYNWRGAFGIHTWIATKRGGADHCVKPYNVMAEMITAQISSSIYRATTTPTPPSRGVTPWCCLRPPGRSTTPMRRARPRHSGTATRLALSATLSPWAAIFSTSCKRACLLEQPRPNG